MASIRLAAADGSSLTCPPGSEDVALPPGFCSTVFADNLGHARHLVVAPNGVVYVNTRSGKYYGDQQADDRGYLVALVDTTGEGHANRIERFGPSAQDGSAGGSGLALYQGGLYAEIDDRIVRYALPADGSPVPLSTPDTIVSGLPPSGDHHMHSMAIDDAGHLFINSGSATNSCQRQNRMPSSPGKRSCGELKTRASIWKYDAGQRDQVFSPSKRYATGIRNAVGVTIDPETQQLYATQHGRDQLFQNWPHFYSAEQGAGLPAEELLKVTRGADYGWPQCHFDDVQNKLVLAPEYGGDGGKKVGVCAGKRSPIAVFPAHWAPNALVIYRGREFPAAYSGGVFIGFHGSWNRAPPPQGGYSIVCQRMTNGRKAGRFVVLADGFAGTTKGPGKAAHRPSGVAIGPAGALHVSDDVRGYVWRIVYRGGNPTAPVEAVQESNRPAPTVPDARAEALPTPPGETAETVALGARIFRGEIAGASCSGCHGLDGTGTPFGPNLTSGEWTWNDGSVRGIERTISEGVVKPKNYPGAMPPMGGTPLSSEQITQVASYIWALAHR